MTIKKNRTCKKCKASFVPKDNEEYCDVCYPEDDYDEDDERGFT